MTTPTLEQFEAMLRDQASAEDVEGTAAHDMADSNWHYGRCDGLVASADLVGALRRSSVLVPIDADDAMVDRACKAWGSGHLTAHGKNCMRRAITAAIQPTRKPTVTDTDRPPHSACESHGCIVAMAKAGPECAAYRCVLAKPEPEKTPEAMAAEMKPIKAAVVASMAANGQPQPPPASPDPGSYVRVPRETLRLHASQLRYRAVETYGLGPDNTDAGAQMVHTADTLDAFAVAPGDTAEDKHKHDNAYKGDRVLIEFPGIGPYGPFSVEGGMVRVSASATEGLARHFRTGWSLTTPTPPDVRRYRHLRDMSLDKAIAMLPAGLSKAINEHRQLLAAEFDAALDAEIANATKKETH